MWPELGLIVRRTVDAVDLGLFRIRPRRWCRARYPRQSLARFSTICSMRGVGLPPQQGDGERGRGIPTLRDIHPEARYLSSVGSGD